VKQHSGSRCQVRQIYFQAKKIDFRKERLNIITPAEYPVMVFEEISIVPSSMFPLSSSPLEDAVRMTKPVVKRAKISRAKLLMLSIRRQYFYSRASGFQDVQTYLLSH